MDQKLQAEVLAYLDSLLPDAWTVNPETPANSDAGSDVVVEIETGRGFGRLLLDVRSSLTPRDVSPLIERQTLTRRLASNIEHLVAAPYLSPTTQARLTEAKMNYLDLTGNVRIRLQQPAVLIRTEGARMDPTPRPTSTLTLRGRQAGRLVRALVDFSPPYSASALAAAAGVSISYTSRQLSELDREALVDRDRRGRVIGRDWAGLLRARAVHYSVLTTNDSSSYIAPTGARELYEQVTREIDPIRAITGSFAASRIAPIAAPAQLLIYVDDATTTADRLGLLPADSGADVVLLEPLGNEVVYERSTLNKATGLRKLAISQIALDCLSGNGRMPAEGEALLTWMSDGAWQRQLPRSG